MSLSRLASASRTTLPAMSLVHGAGRRRHRRRGLGAIPGPVGPRRAWPRRARRGQGCPARRARPADRPAGRRTSSAAGPRSARAAGWPPAATVVAGPGHGADRAGRDARRRRLDVGREPASRAREAAARGSSTAAGRVGGSSDVDVAEGLRDAGRRADSGGIARATSRRPAWSPSAARKKNRSFRTPASPWRDPAPRRKRFGTELRAAAAQPGAQPCAGNDPSARLTAFANQHGHHLAAPLGLVVQVRERLALGEGRLRQRLRERDHADVPGPTFAAARTRRGRAPSADTTTSAADAPDRPPRPRVHARRHGEQREVDRARACAASRTRSAGPDDGDAPRARRSRRARAPCS